MTDTPAPVPAATWKDKAIALAKRLDAALSYVKALWAKYVSPISMKTKAVALVLIVGVAVLAHGVPKLQVPVCQVAAPLVAPKSAAKKAILKPAKHRKVQPQTLGFFN